MHSDPISDMLTRIRNAQAVKKADVWLPYSKLKSAILEILAKEGYVTGFEKVPAHATKLPRSAKKIEQERNNFDQIRVVLRYDDLRRPMIREVKRISKPGRRVYVGHLEIPSVLSGMGIAVLSTPRGMMTNRQARKEGIGGEIICEVY